MCVTMHLRGSLWTPHARIRMHAHIQRDAIYMQVRSFAQLNDSILDAIGFSTCEGLEEASALSERLKRRDFYRQVSSRTRVCSVHTTRTDAHAELRACKRCRSSIGRWALRFGSRLCPNAAIAAS